MKQKKIEHVISCDYFKEVEDAIKELNLARKKRNTKPIEWHLFMMKDKRRDKNILPWLEEVYAICSRAEEEDKAVLVHCARGKNRSATFVAAFLMQKQKNEAPDQKIELEAILDFIR